VALMNQKGGVGKTTTAVNLAAALAESGCRVCLIDLDPQAHLHLGIDPGGGRTVYDLLVDPACRAADCVMAARPSLWVIPSEVDLAAAESELAGQPDRQRILRHKLDGFCGGYDFVLLDCPPSLGLLTLNALSLADEVFVPMQAHFLALQGVGKLLETVGLVCQSVNPDLSVSAIVLCMHEGQTTLAKEVVADLDEFFEQARDRDVPWSGCRVLRPPIRRNIKLAEAPSFGKTIFDYEPWCPGANDYRRLAERMLEDSPRAPAAHDGIAGVRPVPAAVTEPKPLTGAPGPAVAGSGRPS
jgi:chromosome partitioning protein